MTKSERLIAILRYLMRHEAASADDLMRYTGVSPRTIYRDIRTLIDLDVPIYYEHGYRLSREHDIPLYELPIDDLELLKFCLRNNPINAYQPFRQRTERIARRLAEDIRRLAAESVPPVFSSGRAQIEPAPALSNLIIERFLTAMASRRMVVVVTERPESRQQAWIPAGIKLTIQEPKLLLQRNGRTTGTEIPVSRVRKLLLSVTRF